jgi:D-lactate dehydrogenase (cytochrome)
VKELSELLGADRVATGESILDLHAGGLTYHEAHRPDAVVFPESTDDVQRVLAWADRERVPVVPFGAGTSLEGNAIPVHGGVSLDVSRMNRILAVEPENLVAIVQPGVTRLALNERLGRDGLLFRYEQGYDGMAAAEGAFGICGFWRVENLALRGDVEAAERAFERVLSFANDLGLFGEEIDVETGAALGNFPQAYTHVGLINAALAIERAQRAG